MFTGKLDQSLDDILQTRRQSGRRGRGSRHPGTGRPAASQAPVGGVSKTAKPAKQNKVVPTAPAAATGTESKIMISNLPLDIEENQLKDFFVTAVGVGKPKRILMQYGPTGRSLGSATVIFNRNEQAIKATSALDKVKIDNRPIRVEVLVSAANVPTPAPKPSLADRVSQPKKDKPKPVTATKGVSAEGRGRGRGRARGRGGRDSGREGRGKKKTLEELDAEMADYFPTVDGTNDGMVSNGGGGAPANGGGDTAMDDEML